MIKNKILSGFFSRPTLFILFATLFAISGSEISQAKEKSKSNTKEDDHYERISKNLDLFNYLYKEMDLFYVDTINPDEAVKNGIDAMLSELDPYTVYIPKEDEEDFKFMLTGEYAGVGASIGKINGETSFIEIYEGTPAFKNGIKAGDRLLEVDGKKTDKLTVNEVSDNLRGPDKTEVNVLIKDPITERKKKVTIQREKITLPTIEYADTIGNGIGYIRFSSFTEKSASAFKKAFTDLKGKKKISSLVVDLRNNPGGLLDQAVEIINYFIPNLSTIVYTKSKMKQLDETYKATKKPIDEEIPMVILVNRSSASAAEIFAGVMQDLDRAVIIGERTYGKGLVQSTREMPYGGKLKITIAKYYIPSGRCIQAINYAERDKEGNISRIPDSLTSEYKTKNGRIVRDGCGIMADIEIKPEYISTIGQHLLSDNIIFNYVTRYVHNHPEIAKTTDFKYNDYNDFKDFVKKQDFSYKLKTETILKSLRETAKEEGYLEISATELDSLERKLTHNLDQDLALFENEITEFICVEIMRQTRYQKGGIAESLKYDNYCNEAKKLLKDKERYDSLLQPQKEKSKKIK